VGSKTLRGQNIVRAAEEKNDWRRTPAAKMITEGGWMLNIALLQAHNSPSLQEAQRSRSFSMNTQSQANVARLVALEDFLK
jgi:hypothetical protein